ncbi:hypothetical protein NAEGRDRAFT_78320 [Naegleria gruberi]|uniref:Uncharacterized protein AM12 n=1 Tax=Naegleria gruberi TaxID=5762 RepID=D2V2Q8_NAEGR|nr:uncharacterized protein NAEGRDRAFT_78320 [Naegleria gruberi]EFC49102.1 hypothetical protein NAEGRDRAFT_78320 [Naegleria gruberi]|eukprot:XP_002681846.1 hypothetical protein NAEGRDRAFT_78320 [Naegleria gruberi strain NEG-M]
MGFLKLSSAADAGNFSEKKKSKKKKNKNKEFDPNHIFGQPLKTQITSIRTSLLIQEEDETATGGKRFVIYPKLLWLCLNWLENNNDCPTTEGIFRLSGQAASISALKEQLIKGKYDNVPKTNDYDSDSDDDSLGTPTADDDEISNYNMRENHLIQKFLVYFYPSNVPPDSVPFVALNRQNLYTNLLEIVGMNFVEIFPQNTINNVSSLLKMYIRELPEPLMTFDHYDMFIASDGIPDDEVRLKVIRNVLRFLPRSNYFVLKKLCKFLNTIHNNSSINKMDASNLAIVFAPNILRPPPMYCNVLQMQLSEARFATSLTESLIAEYEFFFGGKDELVGTKKETPKPPSTKPKISVNTDMSPTTPTTSKTLPSPSSTSSTPTSTTLPQLPTSSVKKPPLPKRHSPSVINPSSGNSVETTPSDTESKPITLPKPPSRETSRSVFANRSDSSKSVLSVMDSMSSISNSREATAEIKRLSRVMKAGDVCFDVGLEKKPPKPLPPRRATVLESPRSESSPTTTFTIPPRKPQEDRPTLPPVPSGNLTFNKPPLPSRFASKSDSSAKPLPPPRTSTDSESSTTSGAARSPPPIPRRK